MMVSVLNNRFGSWFGAFPCNRWIVFLMLLFSSCAVFYPTFNNELMSGWDDQWQVVNAYTAGGMNWENLKPAFLYAFHGQYSPLNQCIYTFIYSFVGYTPGYYHAYSLLFHILNSFLVYVLLRKMLVSVTAFSVRHCAWIAFLVSMFFCIHPMQVETVAWASASKMVVSTSCYLCSTYFFIRYLTDKKRVFYLSSLFFFIVSYGFKEQVVTLPLWFLLILFCYGADLRTFKTWRKLIPFFIIALVMGLFFVLETKSTPCLPFPIPMWSLIVGGSGWFSRFMPCLNIYGNGCFPINYCISITTRWHRVLPFLCGCLCILCCWSFVWVDATNTWFVNLYW